MDAIADRKAAVEMVRNIVLGQLKRGVPCQLAEYLFDLLEKGVEDKSNIGAIVIRKTALTVLDADHQTSNNLKHARRRLEAALQHCRPDNVALLGLVDDLPGVAFREALICGAPHLVIVRGPTSLDRGATKPDPYLRLRAEFRPVLGDELHPLLGSSDFAPPPAPQALSFDIYLRHVIDEFGQLPDLPGRTRNLSLHETMPISVTLPRSTSSRDATNNGQPPILSLPGVVAQEHCWILVGDGGSGKTTALYYLAHHFANRALAAPRADVPTDDPITHTPIPIYIPLRDDGTSLREQIWAALQGPGITCTLEQLDRWIAQTPFLFLVDCLEHTDTPVMLASLQDLMRRASHARLVLASRPHKALSTCSWPEAHIQPQSDYELRSFLAQLLGPSPGRDLFELFAQNALLDPFRRPLFARLLALVSQNLIAQKRFTLAEMFHDVLEEQFLGQWESPASFQIDNLIARRILAHIGYEMLRSNTHSIDRPTAQGLATKVALQHGVAADAHVAEALLNQLIAHGLIVENNIGLQFWHTCFRDYFAATWLRDRRRSTVIIYRLSWQPRWADCLVFYFGFLDGPLLEKRIAHLFFGLKTTVHAVMLHPLPALAARVMLVLRILVYSRETVGPWRKRFVQMLPTDGELLHLNTTSPTYGYSHLDSDDEDTWRHFYDLVGQLGIAEAYAYLLIVRIRNFAAAGLLHSPDEWVIDELGKSVITNNPDALVTNLFLTSAQARCTEFLRHAARSPDPMTRAYTISAVRFATALYKQKYTTAFLADLEAEWAPLLTDYVLHDESEVVRENAIRFLRYLGSYSGRTLPQSAKEAFIRALDNPDAATRRRAITGLEVPSLRNRMDILWRLLDDDVPFIVLTALSYYRLYNLDRPSRYALALLKVLRRYAREYAVLKDAEMQLRSALKEQLGRTHSGRCRAITLMVAAAYFAPYNELKRSAIRALSMLVTDSRSAPLFEGFLWSDIWEEARVEALWAVANRLAADSGPVALRALQDESARVRQAAATICDRDIVTEAFHPISGPILFQLLSDGDPEVRRYASYALKKYRYLDEDWYPELHHNPVYLGPRDT